MNHDPITHKYMFDHEWQQERNRLACIEANCDPITILHLEKINVGKNWKCLESSGAGSISKWLCQRVGTKGHVVTTDIKTQFLNELNEPNLEIRNHDITIDKLEINYCDLVHARFVLSHLPQRKDVLRKMISALKLRGWILLEDFDFCSFIPIASSDLDLCQYAFQKTLKTWEETGADPYYGRQLEYELLKHNLNNINMAGHVLSWGGSQPMTNIYLLSIKRLKDKVLDSGALSESEFHKFLSLIQEDNFRAICDIQFSAWAQV